MENNCTACQSTTCPLSGGYIDPEAKKPKKDFFILRMVLVVAAITAVAILVARYLGH